MPKRYFFYLLLAVGVCWGAWNWEEWRTERVMNRSLKQTRSELVVKSPLDNEVNTFLTDTRRMYNASGFEDLEASAKAIRAERQTFSDGSWKIVRFYKSLECRRSEPESMWRLHDEIHRKWIAAKPVSVSAKLAYADFLLEYAYFGRRSVGNDPDSAQAIELFRTRLGSARKVLEEAEKLQEKDPVWWLVALRVGVAQVWPTAAMNAMLENGHKAEPQFWEFDLAHASLLVSGKYGKPGDWEAFALKVATRPNGIGFEGYARVVMGMSDAYNDIFKQSKAQWPITKEGLAALIQRFPDSQRNVCRAGDLAVKANDFGYAHGVLSRLAIDCVPRDLPGEQVYGFQQEVREAFAKRNFAWLDKVAAGFLGTKERFGDGSWKIARFYEALEAPAREEPESVWQAKIQAYKDWSAGNLQSFTARIAYADFLTHYAWHARGSGYINTVTKDGYQQFEERLAVARRVLEGTKTIKEKDPYAWKVALTVALGQGWSRSEYDTLVESGRRFEPEFWYCDRARAYSMLPRWYGKEGDWEVFALAASQRPKGAGVEGYARIAFGMKDYYRNIFKESEVSWPKVREGVRLVVQKYPDSVTALSEGASLALLAEDRATAKELFERLGLRYQPGYWNGSEHFLECYRWALAAK